MHQPSEASSSTAASATPSPSDPSLSASNLTSGPGLSTVAVPGGAETYTFSLQLPGGMSCSFSLPTNLSWEDTLAFVDSLRSAARDIEDREYKKLMGL
jgi:hypothetical protein